MEQIDKLIQSKQSRRRFLAGAGAIGAVGAATLLTGCNDSSSGSGTTTPPPTTPTPQPLDIPDNDILNFALNLEYLEAEFYLYAATGSGLPANLVPSGSGSTKGGAQIAGGNIPTAITNYLNAIAQDEMNHVAAIQATITKNSGTPVPRPSIDFTAFAALAGLAKITAPAVFNPFNDYMSFLVGAFVFEDVGVTAYNGAAPAISSTAILDAAAGIAAVEAYHAAEIRTLIAGMASVQGADLTFLTDANLISTLRAAVGGGMETPLSISSIVSANATTSVGFARTTSQVLSIVYANNATGTASGGFFPNGLNGSIKTV